MAHGSGGQRRELYRTELNNASWDVPLRYQNLKAIGSGAYGLVCYAEDRESTSRDKRVAIKKLHRPFSTETHAKRAYREIMMLQHFHHENLICLLDLFSPTTVFEDFNEVYLVTPYLDADLNTIVQSQKLSDEHIQFLLYQILRGLKYIHSAGIIHRDLKPNNLGVNENVELKILDFGLARSTAAEMTGYVVCRWYRAPEIILNWMHYNDKVDIWSVGCILGEMLCGKPLFKGNDYIDQLNKILHLVGKPNAESMKKIASADARNYIESLPAMKRKDFHQVFRGSNVLAINLLERMLDLDPDTRIGVLEALAHPYMKQYADETDEPVAPPFDDSFEDLKKDALGWKELIYQAVMQFKPREPEML